MLAVFCLRLAFGMIACLGLLPPDAVNPRYYRTHFLTAFGLALLALLLIHETAAWPLLAVLGLTLFLAFSGSVSWALEGAPGGRALIALTALSLGAGLILREAAAPAGMPLPLVVLGNLTSAALLGSALSAMLLGHIYLIAPGMSLRPLLRLLAAVAVSLVARLAVDGLALGYWTAQHSFATLGSDTLLWLPLRWGMGLVLPLGLSWMAWQTVRIRSTQSATGILYVVVIFCFLGELTSQLLRETGVTL